MKKNNSIFVIVFGHFWAFWGAISFIATFLVIFIPSMCAWLFTDFKKGQDYFIKVSRLWMHVWLFLIGCSPKVYGWENFKKGENYVVTFNHNALLDVPLSAPFVPGANCTIAKKSFTAIPLFGLFYRRGSVLVDRKNEGSRRKSFDQMKKVLRTGMHMCIYPEGTRNKSKESLKPFYDGAFKLAQTAGKSVMPCVITGTARALPHYRTFFLLPTKLGMHFLKPISSENKTSAQLREEVRNEMLKCYEQNEKWTRL